MKLPRFGQMITKCNFCHDVLFLLIVIELILYVTVVALHTKVGICTGFGRSYRDSSTNINVNNPFTNRVLMLIGSTHKGLIVRNKPT